MSAETIPRSADRRPEAAETPLLPVRQPEETPIIHNLPSAYRLAEEAERNSITSHPPRCVYIEVANQCNLRCQTCPHTFAASPRPRALTWRRFLHITEQFPAMERAVLHGVGEPLLNKTLPRMIAHLKTRGATVLFNANGVLLDDDWSRALITSGLDELRISLDAGRPETYARIRGKRVWSTVVEQVQHFVSTQRQAGVDRPRVSLWMTGMRENIAELPELIRLASRIGVPEVYVQRLVYYVDTDNPPGLMSQHQALFDAADQVLEQIMARSAALACELGVALYGSGATDARSSLAASTNQGSWETCTRPWTTTYVTATGDCLPCCFVPFASAERQSVSMGNLFERPFSEIWNGKAYETWRTELLSEHPPAACRGCGTRWSL